MQQEYPNLEAILRTIREAYAREEQNRSTPNREPQDEHARRAQASFGQQR